MDIEKISEKFAVRRLNKSDIPKIYELCIGNSLYYEHCPPAVTESVIYEDMNALPPKKCIKTLIMLFRSINP